MSGDLERTVHGTSSRGTNVEAIASTSRTDGRAAAAGRAVRVQRLDFVADSLGGLARRRAGRDAQPHFVRLRHRGRHRLAVQRVDADQVAADVAGRNPERSQPLARRRRPRAAPGGPRPLPAYEICPSPMKPSR